MGYRRLVKELVACTPKKNKQKTPTPSKSPPQAPPPKTIWLFYFFEIMEVMDIANTTADTKMIPYIYEKR